jgi:hypothetical protein
MQNPAPAPRLPLQPDARPLYRPPPRLGCSGVTLVMLVALLAFVVLFVIYVPQLLAGLRGFSLPRVLGLDRATPTALVAQVVTPGPDATLTAGEPDVTPILPDDPTATPLPPPTATPEPEYVAIGNSAGDNVALRAEPRADGKKLIALPPRTLLQVIGADTTTDGKLWRNVRTTGDSPLIGWILAQYLVPPGSP